MNKDNSRSNWKPRTNTGKTRFNREKKEGESWTILREKTWGPNYTCTEKWC